MIHKYMMSFAGLYTTIVSSIILYQHIEHRNKLIEQAKTYKKTVTDKLKNKSL